MASVTTPATRPAATPHDRLARGRFADCGMPSVSWKHPNSRSNGWPPPPVSAAGSPSTVSSVGAVEHRRAPTEQHNGWFGALNSGWGRADGEEFAVDAPQLTDISSTARIRSRNGKLRESLVRARRPVQGCSPSARGPLLSPRRTQAPSIPAPLHESFQGGVRPAGQPSQGHHRVLSAGSCLHWYVLRIPRGFWRNVDVKGGGLHHSPTPFRRTASLTNSSPPN